MKKNRKLYGDLKYFDRGQMSYFYKDPKCKAAVYPKPKPFKAKTILRKANKA